jgi:hypothetical protein
MKCRHCLVEFHDNWDHLKLLNDKDGTFWIGHTTCPACKRLHVAYTRGDLWDDHTILYPRSVSREPLDPAVPVEFEADYVEACNVLELSPKASAALSRRIMQHVLREYAKVKASNLDKEIQAVLDAKMVPTHIAGSLDAVRTAGNFAAHTTKSTSSGEIVDVEPGEAEWNLDTIEALFDFYFVQPAKTTAKRAALNEKLTSAGKPVLK